MNEYAESNLFTQDIERILRAGFPDDNECWPESYRREMKIVNALAEADFSTESRVRQTLKRRLLSTRVGGYSQLINSPDLRRTISRFSIVVLLAILLILVSTPLGATLAQTLVETIQTWRLGEHTTAVSVDGNFEALPDENGDTMILPADEFSTGQDEIEPGSGVESSQGRHISLDPTLPFDRAQELVTFTLQRPAFTPEGYEFLGAVVIRSGQASLEYVNWSENRLIGLLQTATGESNGGVQVTFSSDMMVEDVEVDGVKALWAQAGDEGILIWEVDGVNYQLNGVSELGLALQIAESIK